MRVKRVKNIDYNIVEKIECKRASGASYIEALIDVCDEHEIDIDDVVEMIPDNMVAEIKIEFVKNKMVFDEKSSNKLTQREKVESLSAWLSK